MKKIIALVLAMTLILALSLTSASAEEYAGAYLHVNDFSLEVHPFIFTPEETITFNVIVEEDKGVFLQFGDIITEVDDFVFLRDELYVSLQDVVETYNARNTVEKTAISFYSSSRFELSE